VDSVRAIRDLDLKKKPCISETLDWARSLVALSVDEITGEVLSDTLNVICKYKADSEKVRANIGSLIG